MKPYLQKIRDGYGGRIRWAVVYEEDGVIIEMYRGPFVLSVLCRVFYRFIILFGATL